MGQAPILRSLVSTKLASLLAPLAFLAACGQTSLPLPEVWRFHFPTGMAIDTPYALGQQAGARAHFLYLAGNSNFDQAASRGVVMAVDLDAYGPPDTGLVPPGFGADGGEWDGTPLQFPDVGDAGSMVPNGFVYTDGLGGELRLSPTSAGGQRVVLASRQQNRLTFIDVDPGGATLSCFDGDAGQDCLNPSSSPQLDVPGSNGGNEILDVFALSYPVQAELPGGGLGPPELFVGNLRNITSAVSSVAGAPNPYTTTSATSSTSTTQAFVIRQSVDDPACSLAEYAGEVPAAGVMGLAGPSGVYAILTGRFDGLSDANLRVLTLPPPSCPSPPPPAPGQLALNMTPATQTIDLSQILKETDGRGLALSSSGDRVFALSIGPDSLVVLRIDGEETSSLNLHPSTVVPLPDGPSEMVAIPRLGPDGSPVGDLVAVSCPGANVLAFYDDEIGTVTAALSGVGDEPFAITTAPRTLGTGPGATLLPGVRLFVTAFGSGQVAVVDLPDPLDATTARVIAYLGSYEDTTASPVNPLTSQILTLPYGYSGGTPGGI